MLSIVMPYYMNPGMLSFHYETWKGYAEERKVAVEVIIVDDGSPVEKAVDVVRPEGLPTIRIYEVTEDRPWHQHAARNLGAKEANGPWLLLTDMDHVMPDTSLAAMFKSLNKFGRDDEMSAFILPRLDWPEMNVTVDRQGIPKPHPNTFVLRKEVYWQIGGYDEDYCGIYGTDGLFRHRMSQMVTMKLMRGAPITRFSREVLKDASTRTLPRKEGRQPNAKKEVLERKIAEGRENSITVLNFPWKRVL